MATVNAYNVANFALTRGKRIGFLPGTYNVSTYMDTTSGGYNGAIQIDSGTSAASTYYGSSNSSGAYTRGTATITALTAGGAGGGGLNYPANGPILQGWHDDAPHRRWVTIDGLTFTGYSFKAVRIGGLSVGYPAITGAVAIQNCTFTGQTFNGVTGSDNESSIWMDGVSTSGLGLITNNWFHDNQGQGGSAGDQHLTSIFLFNSANVTITYNTGYNSGGLAWGKDSANQGTTVAYNYVDMSMQQVGGGAMSAFNDFTGAYNNTTGLTLTTNIHHNIAVTYGAFGMSLKGAAVGETWQTPVNIYNNTIVMSGGAWPQLWAVGRSAGEVSIYNNIFTGSSDTSGYGTNVTGYSSLALNDYNGYMTGMSWGLGASQSPTAAIPRARHLPYRPTTAM